MSKLVITEQEHEELAEAKKRAESFAKMMTEELNIREIQFEVMGTDKGVLVVTYKRPINKFGFRFILNGVTGELIESELAPMVWLTMMKCTGK